MAFNGSGVFSLVSGNPVVTGTVISSTWANNTLSDIANGLTDCITKDGQSTPTANIPMATFKITGLGNGTNPQDAVALSQLTLASGVVGTMRNAAMLIVAAAATATFTADEIVVESALGAQSYKLFTFSKTINLATTGAGGMDTGVAPTSGFVAIYAIYNATTGASALLATNAATLQPNVYGGANMPAGYTASALVSVWKTDASKFLVIGSQLDRRVYIQPVTVLSTTTTQSSFTSLSITSAVPLNAKTISGTMNAAFSVTAGTLLNIQLATFAVGAVGVDTQQTTVGGAAGTVNTITGVFRELPPTTTGFIAYVFTVGGGTGQGATVQIGNYTF